MNLNTIKKFKKKLKIFEKISYQLRSAALAAPYPLGIGSRGLVIYQYFPVLIDGQHECHPKISLFPTPPQGVFRSAPTELGR
ncbi:hypothetical protein AYI68_g457, partial [Smittium mucronatum]